MVGKLVSVEGDVDIRREGAWRAAELNTELCQADTIRVGRNSRAAAALVNNAILRLDQNTTLDLISIREEEEESSLIGLIKGVFASFSRRPRTLTAETAYLNATIEGTEFAVSADAERSVVTVLEGTVVAANEQGRLSLTRGQSAQAAEGQAPQPRVIVRPEDAVQWALFYPPVMAALGGQGGRAPADAPAGLQDALALGVAGDAAGAIRSLDQIPQRQRDATFHLYRAGLYLNVGRVEAARADIDRALADDANAGLAYALRAVIKVVRNDKPGALSDARRAVELSPDSAAAKIALSYAQQAEFRLDDARATMLEAARQSPEDALARARLAELWLATGYRDKAVEAAQQAVELAPDLARTQVVLGFAELSRIDTTAAKAAFARAIELRSSDPLPWLGQGLARIRESDLEGGRRDIEVAVGLDSTNALLRSYLGKAYFEEKRNPLAAQQLEVAKDLDPNDPTPYLYDAIRKQSENNPGGALDDLQASIERNDNRAVYRSRLALDADRAARGTSLARVYDDLGFSDVATQEATRSLTLDPGNAAAHRFLSDSYLGLRRREVARTSELLQAQLLQDTNINPVQPSISETNLNIAARGGPQDAGLNEFTPLFERNQLSFGLSGQVGSNETYAGEGVATGIYDSLSMSAGAYSYRTDGFRPNHEIEHDVQNLFFQAAVTPELNVQAEVRNRETSTGDINLDFDPDAFDPEAHTDLDKQQYRVGLRYSPTPDRDFIFSGIHARKDEDGFNQADLDFGVFQIDAESQDIAESKGNQGEFQVQQRFDSWNVIAGGALADVDRDRTLALVTTSDFAGFPPFVPPIPSGTTLGDELSLDEEISNARAYAYVNLNWPENVTWTLGGSYDDINRSGANREEFSPKFGVQWQATEKLRLRAAAFQAVKPVSVANLTIEPTQVAGFNQLFDDTDGTFSEVGAVGIDWAPTDNLFFGAEVMHREFEEVVELVTLGTPASFSLSDPVDRTEDIGRVYAHWNPIDELALSAETVFDRYRSDEGAGSDLFPKEVRTIKVPVGARYFHSSGFFAGAGVTFVDQEVERHPASSAAEGGDEFVLVDVGIGFRLPEGRGVVSLQIANLFDTDFNYQDDNYREFRDEPTAGPFFPERTFLIKGTLRF